MSEQLVAGVDCSTQGTKVVVLDLDSGRQVASGRSAHEVTGSGGTRETDPDLWWDALRAALGETGCAGEIAAISVAGQQHGLVVTDGGGRPLRPAVLWNDTRSAVEANELRDRFGADWWAERVGVVPVPSITVTRWAWLRRTEPQVAADAAAVRLPHDWLTERLCGRGVTDRGDASGTGWWSTRDEAYLSDVLEAVELDSGLLPDVLEPHEVAGAVPLWVAEELGLRPGTVVGPGTGDNMGAALGLGLRDGEPVISLGTSGTAYARMTGRPIDPTGTIAGFADAAGGFLPLAATLNCTPAVDRVAAWLGLDREAAADQTDVVFLPYFDGERTPNLPHAAGLVTGLRHDTTREEILLAAYQGAAASLLDAIDLLGRVGSGLDARSALLLIGGGARGRVWQRVIAELSGRAVQVPDAPELVALGAAAQAAACLTGERPDEVSERWGTRAGPTIEPRGTGGGAALARLRATRDAAADLLDPPR